MKAVEGERTEDEGEAALRVPGAGAQDRGASQSVVAAAREEWKPVRREARTEARAIFGLDAMPGAKETLAGDLDV